MDVFAGLDGLNPSSSKKLSLAEQQKRQTSQKARLVDDLDLLSGQSSPTLGSFTPPPRETQSTPASSSGQSQNSALDDDLFGIFTSAPPKQPSVSPQGANGRSAAGKTTGVDEFFETQNQSKSPGWRDDDRGWLSGGSDPLQPGAEPANGSAPSANGHAKSARGDPHPAGTDGLPRSDERQARQKPFAYDRELAQLLDMGFEPVDARRALEAMNGSVRGSVSWLMAEAQGLPLPTPRRQNGFAQQLGAGDFSDLQAQASQLTSSVFSKASSLFSKGRKELEKAYNQYNNPSKGSASEPAWMRDKAKYDRRKAFTDDDFEMPQRRREERAHKEYGTDDRAKQPPTQPPRSQTGRAEPARADGDAARAQSEPPRDSGRRSRAELFRQRQKERAGMPGQTELSNTSPSNAAEAPSSRPSEAATTERVPTPAAPALAEEPGIDLLNLGSTPAGGSVTSASLSATSRDIYATSRELGSASFRNGDYEKAVEHYTAALQMVPETNILRAVLLSNRAAASMKAGDLRGAFDDTESGLKLLPTRGRGLRTEEGTDMADIWVKLVTRNAQAAESMEKFAPALSSWQLLLDNGHATATVLAAKRRCNAALKAEGDEFTPPAAGTSERTSSDGAAAGAKKNQRRGWGTTGATPTTAAGKEALAKVKAQHSQLADEERQRDQLRDKIGARIDSWKSGNEANLRTLLSTLHTVLWSGCDWTPVNAGDLVVPRKVRVVYMKAVARTHPDKVPSTAPVEVKMISQSVFVILQTAWESFRQENNM